VRSVPLSSGLDEYWRAMVQTQQRLRPRARDNDAPIIPILARKVREVEQKSQKGKLGPTNRTKFQVIALLMREERARVKNCGTLDGSRAELLKRLDGIAQILAKTAARDTSLIVLLEPDASISTVAQRFRRDWLLESGAALSPDELIITKEPEPQPALAHNQVIPPSVRSRQWPTPSSRRALGRSRRLYPRDDLPIGNCSGRCSNHLRQVPVGRPRPWSYHPRPRLTGYHRVEPSS